MSFESLRRIKTYGKLPIHHSFVTICNQFQKHFASCLSSFKIFVRANAIGVCVGDHLQLVKPVGHSSHPTQYFSGLQMPPPGTIITTEDKDNSASWSMDAVPFLTMCWELLKSKPDHWRLLEISLESAAERIQERCVDISKRNQLFKWGSSDVFQECHVPYLYCTVKSKCFRGAPAVFGNCLCYNADCKSIRCCEKMGIPASEKSSLHFAFL